MGDNKFQILVVRLLAAILEGVMAEQIKTRRFKVVLSAADKWVSEKQQNEGITPTMDWADDGS